MQQSLFNTENHPILPFNGEVLLFPQLFTVKESNTYFDNLLKEINWKQEPITIYGREVMQPRLTAWYGDDNKTYSYSGITMHPNKWTDDLFLIKQRVESISGAIFNSALLNQYRDGKDSVGWHRDNEKETGNKPG